MLRDRTRLSQAHTQLNELLIGRRRSPGSSPPTPQIELQTIIVEGADGECIAFPALGTTESFQAQGIGDALPWESLLGVNGGNRVDVLLR